MLSWALAKGRALAGAATGGGGAPTPALDRTECTRLQAQVPRSLRYERTPPTLGTYDGTRPTLAAARAWVALRGTVALLVPGQSLLGVQLLPPSWTSVYAVVTASRLHLFDHPDDPDKVATTTLALADVWVDAAPACDRAHAWAVHPIGATPVVLAAASSEEQATWLSALRHGSPMFRAAAAAWHTTCATRIQRAYRRWRARIAARRRRHAAVTIQRVWRGHRARQQYAVARHRIVRSQAYARRWLARQECERRRLRGRLDQLHVRRTHIVREMAATEASYLADLHTALDVFLKPMRAFFEDSPPAGSPATPPTRTPDLPFLSPRAQSGSSGSPGTGPLSSAMPLGPASVVGALQASLEALLPVHTAFLNDLQTQVATWTETAAVGPVFVALATRLEVYVPYAARYDGALAAITDAQQRQPRVRALLEAAADLRRVRRLDVGAFLIMPIQRLPRYGLLLRDLLRYTWDAHPDRAALADALVRVQAATTALNEARRREEARRRTQAVLDRFAPTATAASAQLRDSDAVCLHEGLVAAVHVTGKGGAPAPPVAGGEGAAGSKRALLLFSDQLVLSVRARRSMAAQVRRLAAAAPSAPRAFTDATALPLATLVTAAVDVDDRRLPHLHGFAVATEHAVYRFFVAAGPDRADWIARINAARTALAQGPSNRPSN